MRSPESILSDQIGSRNIQIACRTANCQIRDEIRYLKLVELVAGHGSGSVEDEDDARGHGVDKVRGWGEEVNEESIHQLHLSSRRLSGHVVQDCQLAWDRGNHSKKSE